MVATGALSSVHIQDIANNDTSTSRLPCSNLVLAAGPFTTRIFHKLFTNAPLILQNHVQQSHWFHVNTAAVKKTDSALRLPDAAKDERKLENEIWMVPNAFNHVLCISGITTRVEDEDLSSNLAQVPGRKHTGELKAVAARYLDPDRVDVQSKSNIVERGRSELSVANGMRPIIDYVPTSGIRRDEDNTLRSSPDSSGVWLCYGFGKYGTTVAPGAAKILVSMLLGKMSEALPDEDQFGLTRCVKTQVQGKGKGKQKAW